MLLIYGNLVRGIWILVFTIMLLARGTVATKATLCQVSGFSVQYGTETSGQLYSPTLKRRSQLTQYRLCRPSDGFA
jgi:hypothetical protein